MSYLAGSKSVSARPSDPDNDDKYRSIEAIRLLPAVLGMLRVADRLLPVFRGVAGRQEIVEVPAAITEKGFLDDLHIVAAGF